MVGGTSHGSCPLRGDTSLLALAQGTLLSRLAAVPWLHGNGFSGMHQSNRHPGSWEMWEKLDGRTLKWLNWDKGAAPRSQQREEGP